MQAVYAIENTGAVQGSGVFCIPLAVMPAEKYQTAQQSHMPIKSRKLGSLNSRVFGYLNGSQL